MSTQSFSIVCPNCKVQFPLTEILAQPFIDAERAKAQLESKELAAIVRNREQELAHREKAMAELENQLGTRQTEIDAIVAAKLQDQHDALAKAADKKAADAFAAKLLTAEQELAEKQAKLTEAEDAELALRKERRALEDEKRRLELEIERRLQDVHLRVREATQDPRRPENAGGGVAPQE
jgi:predicted  nucleic acid-binding Zn-ribbon protein